MTPEEALALAKKLARKGDIPAAMSLYQGLLERNPRNKKAKKELKALQQRQGGTASATSMEEQFRELIALHAGVKASNSNCAIAAALPTLDPIFFKLSNVRASSCWTMQPASCARSRKNGSAGGTTCSDASPERTTPPVFPRAPGPA